jgi:(+)-trans-carveol dehydrogenase
VGYRVAGKVALVTGAARGQGRSHAVRLAEEGADIIAVDICAAVDSVAYALASPDDLATTARAIEAQDRRVISHVADVRDFDSLRAAVDDGVAQLGRLDIICANAGIISYGLSHELSESTWRDVIDTNLTGVWHTIKASVPHVIAGGRGGSIVITSSAAGLRAYPNVAHYVAAKHGLVGLMRAVALELAPHGIRVNTVHPMSVDTEMVHNPNTYALFAPDMDHPTRETIADRFQTLSAMPIPWAQVEDITNAVLFLASDEARYVTGVTLPVDGGTTIK